MDSAFHIGVPLKESLEPRGGNREDPALLIERDRCRGGLLRDKANCADLRIAHESKCAR